MKILVACEESQAVTAELRRLGHEAYSCDRDLFSGQHPEWHIMADVSPLLNGRCKFKTLNGDQHAVKGKWDMIIAFPPCTDLAVSGAAWFEKKRENGDQLASLEFFSLFLKADCDRVVIENPVGIVGGEYVDKWFPEFSWMPKCSQMIQPWMFGHAESKKTCLWLKGVAYLNPTDVIPTPINGRWSNQTTDGQNKLIIDGKWIGFNDPRTAKYRSKTYPGIARAMAEQWAGPIEKAINQ